MRNGTKAASWAGVVLASLGMHAVAVGGLGDGGCGRGALAPCKRRPATVEMTVAPPKAPARRLLRSAQGGRRRRRDSPWPGE